MIALVHTVAAGVSRLCAFLPALAVVALAHERDRTKIPDKYTWNPADLYPNDDAWRVAKDALASKLPQIDRFRGQLATSPATLADTLESVSAFERTLAHLSTYAELLADQNTRDAQHQGMQQEVVLLAAAFGAGKSFIEPEILRLPGGTVASFLGREPRLAVYRFYLEDIARRAPHTLGDSEEKLLADAAPMAGTASDAYGIIANADLPYPTVTLADGATVVVDQASFGDLRQALDRTDRERVMSAFFGAFGGFSRTFGTMLNGEVQKVRFLWQARKYPSALAYELDRANIPTTVYTRLVDGVNRHLAVFHRYLRLRRRMLGVEALHYYDLYAPLVASADLEYSPEKAIEHLIAASAPLGPEYQAVLGRAFADRWIDFFPTEGKRSGAYSEGAAYDAHPYVLMNYHGKYTDLSTLAHELGHAMQSYYSNRTQPYPLADYPIFVAEVASTFSEALLVDYMLATIRDNATRLSLLGSYLENIKATVFRQTQFAEFELRMHEMAQHGQPLTGETLSTLYMTITKKYYGHDEGVCVVDDYIAHEWSYIPHFYRDFYVFQYATSFAASAALVENVRAGDARAIPRYLAFLSAGGSKYPIDLLKDAGVDMTTDEPLELTMRAMTRVMDEMERLLAAEAR